MKKLLLIALVAAGCGVKAQDTTSYRTYMIATDTSASIRAWKIQFTQDSLASNIPRIIDSLKKKAKYAQRKAKRLQVQYAKTRNQEFAIESANMYGEAYGYLNSVLIIENIDNH